MLTKKKVTITLVLILFAIITSNFIASKLYLRLDFTGDQRFTLSGSTKNIIAEIKEPLTITSYFSEELPPNIEATKQDFKDLLTEYTRRSGGNIVYEFINPNKSKETEAKAQQEGIQQLTIDSRGKDQFKLQTAYLGAVLQYKGKKEIIPVVQPGSAMEFELSSAIKKMTISKKTKIAIIEGNGEAGLQMIPQLAGVLGITYTIESVNINDSLSISPDYKAIMIIAPTDSFKSSTLNKFDSYLDAGGRILISSGRAKADFKNMAATPQNTGLETWLINKGVEIKNNILIDANCGNVQVQQGSFRVPMQFPYLPIIKKFEKHPVTSGIEAVIFPFSSTIQIKQDNLEGYKIQGIAFSSDKSGAENLPVRFDIKREWAETDFVVSKLVVGAVLEGKNKGNTSAKMVVFSCSEFAVNGQGQQKVEETNINLMANAIDFLADDSGLLELRAKGMKLRPLDTKLSEGGKNTIKYFNLLLPVFLIAGYGLYWVNKRKKQKQLWTEEQYVE